MAIYTLQIKTVCRSDGHSATAKIAYNCRDKITDTRTSKIHKYNSKKKSADLLFTEIIFKDSVIDQKHRSTIWNNAELAENRKDSRTAREYVLALPKELSIQQNIELVREFSRYITYKYNNVAEFAIHDEVGNNGNIHAHVLTTTREFDPETLSLGERTAVEWNNTKCQKYNVPFTQEQFKEIRKSWEVIQNKLLSLANINVQVSCARKEDRSLVKKHLGKHAAALERRGVKTELGDHNRTIDEINSTNQQITTYQQNLNTLDDDISLIDNQIRALEMQIAQDEQLEVAAQNELFMKQQIDEISVPSGNCIVSNNVIDSLFTLTAEQRQIFTVQEFGEYSYFANNDNSIEIHSGKHQFIRCNNFNESNRFDLQLALDAGVQVLKNNLVFAGSNDFIAACIQRLAQNPRYDSITLVDKNQQNYYEKLQFKRDEQSRRVAAESAAAVERQELIAKVQKPDINFIAAKSRFYLFEIAAQYEEYFTKKVVGDGEYYYWVSKDNAVSVHQQHVNVHVVNDNSINLALDIALKKFGNDFEIGGDDIFIEQALEIIVNNDKFSNVVLSPEEVQRRLEDLRKLKVQELLEIRKSSQQTNRNSTGEVFSDPNVKQDSANVADVDNEVDVNVKGSEDNKKVSENKPGIENSDNKNTPERVNSIHQDQQDTLQNQDSVLTLDTSNLELQNLVTPETPENIIQTRSDNYIHVSLNDGEDYKIDLNKYKHSNQKIYLRVAEVLEEVTRILALNIDLKLEVVCEQELAETFYRAIAETRDYTYVKLFNNEQAVELIEYYRLNYEHDKDLTNRHDDEFAESINDKPDNQSKKSTKITNEQEAKELQKMSKNANDKKSDIHNIVNVDENEPKI